jgi:hypothetical protein
MERVLGILGSAILLSLLSIGFLIVDAPRQPPENVSAVFDEPTRYEDLSDEEKLERLQNTGNTSDQALYNRALAYDDTSYCDRISNDSLRDRCEDEVSTTRSTQGQTSASQPSQSDEQALNRAIAYGDASYCDGIDDDALRGRCLNQTQQ